jgi:hypothetical protein
MQWLYVKSGDIFIGIIYRFFNETKLFIDEFRKMDDPFLQRARSSIWESWGWTLSMGYSVSMMMSSLGLLYNKKGEEEEEMRELVRTVLHVFSTNHYENEGFEPQRLLPVDVGDFIVGIGWALGLDQPPSIVQGATVPIALFKFSTGLGNSTDWNNADSMSCSFAVSEGTFSSIISAYESLYSTGMNEMQIEPLLRNILNGRSVAGLKEKLLELEDMSSEMFLDLTQDMYTYLQQTYLIHAARIKVECRRSFVRKSVGSEDIPKELKTSNEEMRAELDTVREVLTMAFLRSKGLTPHSYHVLFEKHSATNTEIVHLRDEWEKYFKGQLFAAKVNKLVAEYEYRNKT